MMIDWKRHFDAIYCIHYQGFQDRMEPLKRQLQRVGILESGILRFKITYRNPFDDMLLKQISCIDEFTQEHLKQFPKHFQGNYAHYQVWKQSIASGFNRILILQDDVKFLKDLDLLKRLVDNLPDDYDLIQNDMFTCNPQSIKIDMQHDDINQYYKERTEKYASQANYSVNMKMMKRLANIFEHNFFLIDMVFHQFPNAKMAFPTTRWSIQYPPPSGDASQLKQYQNAGCDIGDYI